MSDDERRKLLSTEQSLDLSAPEPVVPASISGLETFTLGGEVEKEEALPDADSFFNLPENKNDDEDEQP
jgi:uncharacterized protein